MAVPPCLTGDRAAISAFIDKFDTFLFDCDGVIWQQARMFPGIPEVLNMLKRKGKRMMFVTNANNHFRTDIVKKLTDFGVECSLDQIFTSGYSAAQYIKHTLDLPAGQDRVFLIGQHAMEHELSLASIPYCGGTDESLNRDMGTTEYAQISDGTLLQPDVGAVLFCWTGGPNLLRYNMAYAYLQRGAKFLISNTDRTTVEGGAGAHKTYFLANGAMVAPLVAASGVQPTSMGKPGVQMLGAIERAGEVNGWGLERSRMCMVGDNLETDIRFGVENGLGGTLAVLTGVIQTEDLVRVESEGAAGVRPDAYVESVADLIVADS